MPDLKIAAILAAPIVATVVYGRAIGLSWREVPWLPLVPVLHAVCRWKVWRGDRHWKRRR